MNDLATRLDVGRIDGEPYFMRWNSVLFFPNPDAPEHAHLLAGHSGDVGSIPCHQHKSCGGLTKMIEKYPPRVCVHCKSDTSLEVTAEERELFIKIMDGKMRPTYDKNGQLTYVETVKANG